MDQREMRSLNRPGLYKAFRPLDPNERLPRELLLEDRRSLTWGFRMGRQHVAGVLWLPAVLLTVAVVTWWLGSVAIALAAAGALLFAFGVYAFSNRD